MRFFAVVVVLGLVGCGPSERELARCEGVEIECLVGDRCDLVCAEDARVHRQFVDCCECLAELDCLCQRLTESRCIENLDRGGTICVTGTTEPGDCSRKQSQCGTVCGILD